MRAVLLWLLLALPFVCGVVVGFVVRVAALLWAAVCEGYSYGHSR